MSFTPRMTAQTRAMRTLRPLHWRRWGGVVADVWHVAGQSGGGGFYSSPDPRLVVFLDGAPAGFGLRTDTRTGWQQGVSTFYVPPNAPLWSDLTADAEYAHLDLHLQAGPLAQRLSRLPDTPIMLGANPRVQAVAQIMAEEVTTPARPEMMLDGLLTSLLAEVLDLSADPAPEPDRGGLPPRTLRALTEHVLAHMDSRITVADLAHIAGLSEGWFTRAFARSQNTTPQRWITHLRLTEARRLMADPSLQLAEIAAATGFSDQAHLTRNFGRAFGQTPAAWRRDAFAQNSSNHVGSVQAVSQFPT